MIMKPPDASETIENTSDTFGIIINLSYASVTIVIDVWRDQDDPNDKNRRKGAIRYNSGRSGRLDNEKSGIARIGAV